MQVTGKKLGCIHDFCHWKLDRMEKGFAFNFFDIIKGIGLGVFLKTKRFKCWRKKSDKYQLCKYFSTVQIH